MEGLKKLRQYLLTGVSHVIPFVACGGIMIALAIAFAPMGPKGPDTGASPILSLISYLGGAAFKFLLPVLGGYIAYAMAGKPGLVAGFVGGYLSGSIPATAADFTAKDPKLVSAGFIGAVIAGLLAGWFVNLMKKLKVPAFIRPIMPILIIPIFSVAFVGTLMLKVIGLPIASVMDMMQAGLQHMNGGSQVLLGMVLGAMIAFDMGGPINKTAFFFGVAMIQTNPHVMGACAAAICTPPIGLGLATILAKRLFSDEEREAGVASFAMGFMGITEGAIPFAASDPLRVIPCIVVGSMVSSSVAMLLGVGDHAPHGGPIVLPVVDNRPGFIIAILCGVAVTAALTIGVRLIGAKKDAGTPEQVAAR